MWPMQEINRQRLQIKALQNCTSQLQRKDIACSTEEKSESGAYKIDIAM